jgi:2-polyprenyl-6-methoxyphenol hydroxylase-like FAD-dependent oxidoreductase
MYDVIVVGTRVAGAATAMLLAREGANVLAVDRAAFPSDTLSTHQVQVPGVARLNRWGVLDAVIAAGTPATREVRFDAGAVVLEGRMPSVEGADALYSPRRTLLDKLLVDAARAAGAEVRERFAVDEVLFDADRVTGIRGRARGGACFTERAHLVVGADGRYSMVAKAVGATPYNVRPATSVAYYAYWEGVELDGGQIYARERRMMGAWPTNDGLTLTFVSAPRDEFAAFRADPRGEVARALDATGELGERVRAGRLAERVRGTADLPNRFHVPYGAGWALVGDAGLVMDPVTGQGIADAFRDAELLSKAIVAGLGGGAAPQAALAEYQARRDAAALAMFDVTTDLAAFGPPRLDHQLLYDALAERPEEVDRFFAVLSGVVSPNEFFGPRNLLRLLGVRGMLKAGRARRRIAA